MSDYENNIVGNESQANQAPESSQSTEGQTQVNPGAIRKAQTNGILNALSAASGQQFDSVEAAVAFVARTSAMSQQSGGTAQPKVESQPKQTKNASSDLQDQFQALQSKLAKQEQALREKELDGDIRSAMGDKFDTDLVDYALSKVKSNIQWNDDDGSYSIVNQKGQVRYSQDGEPLTISGLVEEVARSNPKLLKQSMPQGGSGLRPGQGSFAGAPSEGIPDYSRDPAAFNAWAQRNGLGKNVGLKGVGVQVSNSLVNKKIL